MAVNVFSVAIFLVVFRETIEAGIIISVMLAFVKQLLAGNETTHQAYRTMVKQIWVGSIIGLILCLAVGGGVIGTFYRYGHDAWAKAEYYYEGAFYLVAALIITVVGAAMLRINKMQEKWTGKITESLQPVTDVSSVHRRSWIKRYAGKYVLFVLAFFTVAREGIEGVVFVAGVSFSAPASSVPLPVVIGLIAGFAVGFLLYKGASLARLQIFLIISTCLLYLVAAGLVSRAVGYFEMGWYNNKVGADSAELGMGPGSYDISHNVWHLNCCSPDYEGGYGWGIFNGIFGWTNTATYSTVICYNVYWICVIAGLATMRYNEAHGHWPLMKAKQQEPTPEEIPMEGMTVREIEPAEASGSSPRA